MDLPNEIIVKILSFLSHGDLCSFSQVSSRMYSLASTAGLWRKVILSRPVIEERGLTELISYPRYSLVERLDLYQLEISERRLRTIIEQTMSMAGLKKIILYEHVLTNIPADFLARAFSRLEEVVVGGTYLTREQLTTILESCLESGKLKMLDLSNLSKISEDMWMNTGHLPQGVQRDSVDQELSKVSKELLTKSVVQLKKISLKSNKLDLLQWNSILESTPASNLEDFDLSFNSEIIDIPSVTLGAAVASLRKVNLAYATLTDEQLLSIFKLIKSSQTLEELNIGNIKLQDIPREMLTPLCKLKMLNIEGTNLTTEQLNSVLYDIAHYHPADQQKLEILNISRNALQDVPSQHLFDACLVLTSLNISDTYLNANQCLTIFSALPNSNMKSLDISGVRLSSVPTEVLAVGACSLVEVDLSSTMITTKQVIAILTRSKKSKTLIEVVGIGMRNIPEHLEICAKYLSMITPYGNPRLRARRQARLMQNGKAGKYRSRGRRIPTNPNQVFYSSPPPIPEMHHPPTFPEQGVPPPPPPPPPTHAPPPPPPPPPPASKSTM